MLDTQCCGHSEALPRACTKEQGRFFPLCIFAFSSLLYKCHYPDLCSKNNYTKCNCREVNFNLSHHQQDTNTVYRTSSSFCFLNQLVAFAAAPDLPGSQHQPSAPAGGAGSGEASRPADHPAGWKPRGQPGSVALLRRVPPQPPQPAEDQRPGGELVNEASPLLCKRHI